MEPNGDNLPLLERRDTLKQIAQYFDTIDNTPKYGAICIITSRGMGKTFLLKKLGHHQLGNAGITIPHLKEAGLVGRVIGIECEAARPNFGSKFDDFAKFWQLMIAAHITMLFKDSNVNGINFVPLSYESVVNVYRHQLSRTPTERWILAFCEKPITIACQEFIHLSNMAFGTQSQVKPVFLLDNVQGLARLSTDIESKVAKVKHTVLSLLLQQLYEYRPPCLIAGTSDGNLQLITDYSLVHPIPVYLTRIRTKYIQELGQAMV